MNTSFLLMSTENTSGEFNTIMPIIEVITDKETVIRL